MKPNPKQTYMARLLNYDALLLASENECSYCLSEREVQILLAFVDYIAFPTRYQPTDTTIDTNQVAAWSDNLARKLMSGCCDDKLYRFTLDGRLQSSQDNGTTWQDDPQADPRLTATLMPPLPGPDGDDKRCQAANNITAHFMDIAAKLIADAEAWSGLSTLLAIILQIVIFIGIIGSGGLLSPLMLGLAGALLFAGSAAFEAAMTTEVWDQFNCIVYCNLNDDGTCSQAQLSTMIAQSASEFAGIAHEFLARNLILIGLDGVINMGRTMSDREFDCSTCDCVPTCSDPAFFEKGNVTSTVDNGDGTVTFTVETEPEDGTGIPIIVWGNRYTVSTQCCTFWTVEEIAGGATVLQGYIQCGNNPPMVINYPSQGICYSALQFFPSDYETNFTIELTLATAGCA